MSVAKDIGACTASLPVFAGKCLCSYIQDVAFVLPGLAVS